MGQIHRSMSSVLSLCQSYSLNPSALLPLLSQPLPLVWTSYVNGPYLFIGLRAMPAHARARACLYCGASYKQSNQAAAAKRLFWHLTARQIFTAQPSHRKYPITPFIPFLPLRFFLLYSQIGNLYFFRNDLSLPLPLPPRNSITDRPTSERLLRPIK